jgi:hypothetical protein
VTELCHCGCRTPLSGRQKQWATDGCRKAFQRGTAPANAESTRTRKRRGIQPPYRRLIRYVAAYFGVSEEEAQLVVDSTLPERQRQQRDRRAA